MDENMKQFLNSLPLDIASDPIIIKRTPDKYMLAAPESYWSATPEIKDSVTNGCGSKGFGFLVPDKIFGMSITPACDIHDWMCLVYNDEAGFKLSTQVFFDNMQRINHAKSQCRFLERLRASRIKLYYRAVKDFGRLFYYDAHVDLLGQSVAYL